MIVSKFGGSSVADSKQFKKVKNIVKSDARRHVVITSAMGKRTGDDYKVTDLLYLTHAHLQYSVSCTHVFNIIKDRFLQLEKDLELDINIEKEFDSLFEELDKNISIDYLVSRGEYLTAKLLASYLGYTFVDAKDIIKFNYDFSINYEATDTLIQAMMQKYKNIVVPGFYGSMGDGTVRVMKRGGSDITGSIIARSLKAIAYENWTDVSGILMANPQIVASPKEIDVITYDELRELSYMGANVIHEDAIYPVKDLNIPIYIKNTNKPEFKGTKIVDKVVGGLNDHIITGVSGKTNFTTITVYRHNASSEVGLLKKALEVFEKYDVSVENVFNSIDNFSIVVDSKVVEKCVYEIISDLRSKLNANSIKVDNDLALVAVVGRNLANHIGASGSIFKTLGENNINIKMISQGSDEINIILGVNTSDFEKTIRVIYDVFS